MGVDPSEVQSSPRQEGQGATLSQVKEEPGSSGQGRLDFSFHLSRELGFTAFWGAHSGRNRAAVRTELPQSLSWKRTGMYNQRPRSRELTVLQLMCCQLPGESTARPSPTAWGGTALGSLRGGCIRELIEHIFGQARPSILLMENAGESTLSKWQMNQNWNFKIWEGKEEIKVCKEIYKQISVEALFGIIKDKTRNLETTLEWFSRLWYNHIKK